MKTNFTIILLTFLFLASCGKGEIQKQKVNEFENFNEYRKVYTGIDSLQLKPFEMFKIMKFSKDEMASMETETNQYSFNDVASGFYFLVENGFYGKFSDGKNSSSLKLEYYNGSNNGRRTYLNRKLIYGNEYKVIFSYRMNELQNRFPVATEMFDSGYYIIDILPMNEKFPRQNENE